MNSFRTEKYPMGARGIKQVEAKKKKKKNRGKITNKIMSLLTRVNPTQLPKTKRANRGYCKKN